MWSPHMEQIGLSHVIDMMTQYMLGPYTPDLMVLVHPQLPDLH